MNPRPFLTALLLPLLVVALFFAFPVGVALADSPPARFGHSMVNINGDIYLFGGLVPGMPCALNDLWVYNAAVDDWSQVFAQGPLPPARHSHLTTVVDGKMYLFSGMDGKGNILDDHWTYDPDTHTWEKLPPPTSHSLRPLRGPSGDLA